MFFKNLWWMTEYFFIFTFIISSFYACEQKDKPAAGKKEYNYIPKYFYKRMEGVVEGRKKIIMNISGKDTFLTGNFYYIDSGIPNFFTFDSRIHRNDSVLIQGRTGKLNSHFGEIISGTIFGKFVNGSRLEGVLEKPGNPVKYHIDLNELYPSGSYKFVMKSTSRLYGSRETGGASIEYMFPQITGRTNSAISGINNKIFHNIVNEYDTDDSGKKFKDFDSEMNDFIERFRKFQKNHMFPSTYKPFWENSFYTTVVFNSDNIVVFENTDFRFEGGAHPNTFYSFYNFNVKNGRIISPADIFIKGYKTRLDKIGEKKFKEKYNIKEGESLESKGYFLKNKKFHLNDNFAIFAKGLLFKFNPYEIAAYVYGAPDVFIPYGELKGLLKTKSVISGFTR